MSTIDREVSISKQAPPVDDFAKLEAARKAELAERRKVTVRRCVVSFFAVVATLLVMEGLARIAVVLAHPAVYSNKEFDIKYRIATKPLPNADPTVFFLGSSYTSRGVYADLLEKHLRDAGEQVNVRNIACQGSFPSDQLFLLKLAIARGARPAAVVYEMMPLGLGARAGSYSDEFRDSYAGRTAAEKLGNKNSGLISQAKVFIQEHCFIVRYRTWLKEFLSHGTRLACTAESEVLPALDFKDHTQASPGGWMPDYSTLTAGERLERSIEGRILFISAQMPRKSRAQNGPLDTDHYPALEPLAQYCQKNKIPLIVVWLPIHEQFREKCQEILKLTEADLVTRFQTLANDWNAWFIDMHNDDDITHYSDCDHLNVIGSLQASEKLSQFLLSERGKAMLSNTGGGQ